MKKYSIFCYFLTAIFYIVQVSVLGYTVYFLAENGYTAAQISILMGVFGIVAAITQPTLGYIADKNKNIDFKTILTCIGLLVIILFIALYCFYQRKIAIGLLFGTVYLSTNNMSPFINSSCFYYTDRGYNVDYGIARGCGSFSFAVVSYILGNIMHKYGARLVAVNGVVASILLFVVIMIMPRLKDDSLVIKKETNIKSSNTASSNIIMKYPSFFLMVFAIIFAMCFQNSDCGYMINIIKELGGDSSQLGLANAIAAMVEIPVMFLISKMLKKIHVKKMILIACVFYIVRAFVFHIESMTAIYVAQVLQMFTFAILVPSAVYLSDDMMQEEDKNKGQTFIGMAVTTGLILGTFVGGQLISIGGTDLLEIGCIVIAGISFIFALLGNIVKN
ncbi:MAG: MFS transporter [Lachnospiraceae bacterium]|nr:MFS transporter [Lachnospiraceae bacterium]